MKNKLYTIICLLGTFCCACNEFLTEYSNDQAYVRAYTDLDELLAGSVYMKCQGIFYDYQGDLSKSYYPYIHFMADETQVNTSGSSGYLRTLQYLFGYYTWQQEVSKDHEGTIMWPEAQDWQNLYNYINVSNLILSQIDKQEAVTQADQENINRIKGESHFLRGAYYFILANLYGKPYSPATASTDPAVPLKLTEYVEDKIYRRSTVEEVYRQVLEDLHSAEKYLKTIPRKSVVRASHTAVCLLLSRVYLYMQNYEETVKWAKACLEEQPELIDLNSFTGGEFLYKDSPELIFTMGSNHLPTNLTTNAKEFGVSEELYNCYTEEDLRTQYFITKQDEGYAYVKARYAYQKRIDVSDNFALRTAEAYLNLAEASACLGGTYTQQALDAYNSLRRHRISDFMEEQTLTGEALVKEIRQERRRELCLEGHRWFDLRRYMVNDSYPEEKTLSNVYMVTKYSYVSGSYEVVFYRRYTLPPHDGAWTLPIPSEELDANQGMRDNERLPRNGVSLL